VPPEERARAELEALVREAGLGDKEFYFRLCGALRLLLDGRYGADTLERTTEELVPVLRGLPLDDATRASLVELFRAADPVRYADAGATSGRRGADLASVKAPTLVIVGADDVATPPARAERIAAAIDGAALETIPDAGHLTAEEQPQAVTRLLEPFLEQCLAGL
jgi:pimeloyl-ACP methyl ester carboxylesterase